MLSQKTKYALKALLYLAQQPPEHISRTADIAEQAQIPRKFLEAILLNLKRGQLVSSRKGIHGGYYLLRPADEISFADVYRLFDGAIALLPCASENFYEPCRDCTNEQECRLRMGLLQIRQQTLQALQTTSIASILQTEIML